MLSSACRTVQYDPFIQLPNAINLRASCVANLVTQRFNFRANKTLEVLRMSSILFLEMRRLEVGSKLISGGSYRSVNFEEIPSAHPTQAEMEIHQPQRWQALTLNPKALTLNLTSKP